MLAAMRRGALGAIRNSVGSIFIGPGSAIAFLRANAFSLTAATSAVVSFLRVSVAVAGASVVVGSSAGTCVPLGASWRRSPSANPCSPAFPAPWVGARVGDTKAKPEVTKMITEGAGHRASTSAVNRIGAVRFRATSSSRPFVGAHALSHPAERTGRGRGARSEWRLFRQWNFSRKPKAFELHPPLDAPVLLTATTFQAGFHGGPDRTGSSATHGL